MKIVVERHTGQDEMCIIEIQHRAKTDGEYTQPDVLELRALCAQAWQIMDDRVRHNNERIIAAKDLLTTVKDKQAKVELIQFLDHMLGISSQAMPFHAEFKERQRRMPSASASAEEVAPDG